MNLGLVCLFGALQIVNPQATPVDTTRSNSLSALRDSVVQMVSYQNSTTQEILAPSKYGFPVPTSVFCKHLNVDDNGMTLSAVTCRTLYGRPVFELSMFQGEVSREGNHFVQGTILYDWDLDGKVNLCLQKSFINRRQVSNEFLDNSGCTSFYYPLLREFNRALKAKNNKTKIIS